MEYMKRQSEEVSDLELDSLKEYVQSIAKSVGNGKSSISKPAYESLIEKDMTESMGYDVHNYNIFDGFSKGALQCYSGTILNLILKLESNFTKKIKTLISML